jgi:hypothetical protein
MGIVFAMRGGLAAVYSGNGATAYAFGAVGVTTAADTTAASGQVLAWAATNNPKLASFLGRNNLPSNRTISVNLNIRHGYSGTPATTHSWWCFSDGTGKASNFEIGHSNAGNIQCQAKNESAASALNNSAWGSYSASNTSFTDITLVWDGNTNPVRLYINTTLFGTSITPSVSFATTLFSQLTSIVLGSGNIGGVINGGKISEFTVWDQTIDVTSVMMSDGTAAGLTGNRAVGQTINVAAFDGVAYTTLAAASVQPSGTVYTAAGVAFTASYVTVAKTDVRSGTLFGPASSITGSAVIPAASVVIAGNLVDNVTGTYVTVAKTDVRNLVTFGAANSQTGSLVTASAASGGASVNDLGGWHGL